MATINVRVDDDLKKESKEILDELGLDLSSAIKIYLKQIVAYRGLPFEIKMRQPSLEEALDDVKKGNIQRFSSYEELMADLND